MFKRWSYRRSGVPDHNVSISLTYVSSYMIARFEAVDLNTQGTGAIVTRIDGGPNHDYVTVFLQSSAAGREIDFDLRFYVQHNISIEFGHLTDKSILLLRYVRSVCTRNVDIYVNVFVIEIQ